MALDYLGFVKAFDKVLRVKLVIGLHAYGYQRGFRTGYWVGRRQKVD